MSLTSLSSLLGGPFQSGGLTTYGTSPAPQVFPHKWIAVRPRFTQFNKELALTPLQRTDGLTKAGGVVGCLNRRYYGSDSRTDHSFFIGSWGKNTAGRPARDVDLYFVLPVEVYHRFQGHVWNRQSALLQEKMSVKVRAAFDSDHGIRREGRGLLVAFGYRAITILIALVGVCYYLASRREVAQVMHEAEAELEHEQAGEASASIVAAQVDGSLPFPLGEVG